MIDNSIEKIDVIYSNDLDFHKLQFFNFTT